MPDSSPVVTDPFVKFQDWMKEAWAHEPEDANAMTLATATPEGMPSARIVLLKGADARGFVFYTNTQSRKGDELTANAQAALLFHWKTLGRQIRIEGLVEGVTNTEADAYFATRPRISRLGAWASRQSEVIADRESLDARFDELQSQYPDGEVPRPENWGGYLVVPDVIEFWQGRPNRLHDRLQFSRRGSGWVVERLAP